ncbi:MAG: DUF4352 domain-containing protein [Nitrospiraceae bacterium]|nr:DUF4352 domain-containing protein [Nitrospiraceae bacterium]
MKRIIVTTVILLLPCIVFAETEVQKYTDADGVIHIGGAVRAKRPTKKVQPVADEKPARNADILSLVKVKIIKIDRFDSLPARSEYSSTMSPRKGIFYALFVEINNTSSYELHLMPTSSVFSLKTRENVTYNAMDSSSSWSNSLPLLGVENISGSQVERGWLLFDISQYETPQTLSFQVNRQLRGNEKINKMGIPIDVLMYGPIDIPL